MEYENDMYEVSVCQCKEWDWQMSIQFLFGSLEEALKFIELSLEHDHIVQITKNPDKR